MYVCVIGVIWNPTFWKMDRKQKTHVFPNYQEGN